jgi:hypothetical protein
MACSKGAQHVSIAGTVINQGSREIIPGARVRITQAPASFVAELMAIVQASVASNPRLARQYAHLFQNRPVTSDTLKTAQIILDSLSRSQQFTGHRPDETFSGGDGHYCFLNLPPGDYGITAAISTLDYRYGISCRSVQVRGAVQSLSFSQLDIEVALTNTMAPLGEEPALSRLPDGLDRHLVAQLERV